MKRVGRLRNLLGHAQMKSSRGEVAMEADHSRESLRPVQRWSALMLAAGNRHLLGFVQTMVETWLREVLSVVRL